jgi:ElaB/YqjD/DUF883 family membrane-anchored ribosome-binding protein
MSSQGDSSEAYGYEPLGGFNENQDRLRAARDNMNAAFDTARQKSGEAYEQAESYIRNSPMEAVGYAAAIGAVLGLIVGMMMGRRH